MARSRGLLYRACAVSFNRVLQLARFAGSLLRPAGEHQYVTQTTPLLDMERSLFHTRLHEAARHAQDFARTFIEEPLPADIRFQIELNQSYDAGCSDQFRLFPEDSQRGVELVRMDLDDAVDELWRDGMVPQWIDVAVIGETGDFTLLQVICCGRFTADETQLYHQRSKLPPFHVTGPALPFKHVDGVRFSIYNRAHCWNASDLARAARHADKIWSLELFGPAFDDAIMSPFRDDLHRVEILELTGTGVDGSSLGWLEHARRLRVLRIATTKSITLDFAHVPTLPELTLLSLSADHLEVRGVDHAQDSCPHLTDLTLSFKKDMSGVGQLAFPTLSNLSVTSPTVPDWLLALRPSTVHLHCRELSAERALTILDPMRVGLHSVGLRGTPVDDSIFALLAEMETLTYVDLVDTNISHAALEHFIARRPHITHWPRTKAG